MEQILCSECSCLYTPKIKKFSTCGKCRGNAQRGTRNPHYNNGRLTKFGYRQIKINGRYIFEHRHIMQQALGRALTTKERVHHKDGDKLNNVIENLELCAYQGDHVRKHASYRSKTHKECTKCKKVKSRKDFPPLNQTKYPLRDPHQSHCRACVNKYLKTYRDLRRGQKNT